MQFEGSRRSAQVPNLTPLIDIVFLLLIFFMLTAHFVRDEGLPIELPDAATALSLDNDKPLEITISASGQISIAGVEVMPEQLPEQVKELLAARDGKRIVIRGDAGVTLGDSVKVMDAARQAGATGVDIITEQPAGQ